jgi:hypothetical protein
MVQREAACYSVSLVDMVGMVVGLEGFLLQATRDRTTAIGQNT